MKKVMRVGTEFACKYRGVFTQEETMIRVEKNMFHAADGFLVKYLCIVIGGIKGIKTYHGEY